MAANIFEFPIINPLKPVWQAYRFPTDSGTIKYQAFHPAFQTKANLDFLPLSLSKYEQRVSYCTPFQTSDAIRIQWFGSDATTANYTAEFLDKDLHVYSLKTISVSQATGTWDGLKCYYIVVPLWDVPEGKYFIRLRYKHTGTTYSYIVMEPFHLRERHEGTIRLDYSNSFNDQSVIYSAITNWVYQLRLYGHTADVVQSSKFTVYEDQPMNAEMVSGVRFREVSFMTTKPIPEYLATKLEGIFLCDQLKIDNHAYTRVDGSKLESVRTPGNQMANYTLKLRDRYALTTDNYHLNMMILGTMVDSQAFWVETITLNTVGVNVRKGFTSINQFLNYANQFLVPTGYEGGYFAVDDLNQLVFIADPATATLSGTWVLSIVLWYGFRFEINGSGDVEFQITKGGIAGTRYYAVEYGDGTATNRTTLTTASITKTYTNAKGLFLTIYVDDCEEFTDVSTDAIVTGIGGSLPPALEIYSIDSALTANIGVRDVLNNLFTTLNGVNLNFTVKGQELSRKSVDELIMHLYTSRFKLGSGSEVDISDNTAPSVDPGFGILTSGILSQITSLTTD